MTNKQEQGPVRRYPAAPVVGAAGVVLAGDQVLLIKRGREPSKGVWSIPGGAVELGENLQRAVAREIREETGLEVKVGPLVEVVERILRDRDGRIEYHYVLLDYLCWSPLAAPRAGDDADEAVWRPVAEAAAMGLTPDAARVVEKAFRMSRELDPAM